MNHTDSLKLMVYEFPGGIDVVALRIGKPASTLSKELRGAPGYKLGANTAYAISRLCIESDSPNCRAYINAVIGDCGGFVELPVRDDMTRQDLRVDAALMMKEGSDALSVLTDALSDGRLSDNELRAIQREISELVSAAQSVDRGARSVHEASKPAALRSAA